MDYSNFFEQEIILENNHARLTPLVKEDFSELNRIAYDPAIWEKGMSNLTEEKHLEQYIDTALEERKNKLSYPFLIFDKVPGCVAGSTRFGSVSFPNKRLEIGWTWLHPKHQQTGLNRACKFLLLQYAFEDLELNRVEFKTDVLNLQSRTALMKIGAKEEGIFRKYQVTSRNRARDTIFFSITSDEWPQLKETIFKQFSLRADT